MEEFIVVVLCLLVNALLAAYEMAFVSVPRGDLRNLARTGHRDAKILLSLKENPERTLSAIQVGITLVGAVAAAVGGAGAGETLEPYFVNNFQMSGQTAEALSIALVVIPITYLSVVVGELVPKTLALRNPTRIVLGGAKILFVADRVLSPIITLLEWSTKMIMSTFFRNSKVAAPIANTSIEIDSFSPVHQRFMHNMAGIEKRQIQDIFLPWEQVVSVQKNFDLSEVTKVVVSCGHTRLPVRENGRIVGVLNTKEFFALKESGEFEWHTLIRPVLLINPTDSAFRVMRLLQARRNQLAIVVDMKSDAVGIVTLEDILEEVVGDIFDEDDDEKVRKIYASKLKSRSLRGKLQE